MLDKGNNFLFPISCFVHNKSINDDKKGQSSHTNPTSYSRLEVYVLLMTSHPIAGDVTNTLRDATILTRAREIYTYFVMHVHIDFRFYSWPYARPVAWRSPVILFRGGDSQSLASRLFTQPFVRSQIKENIKAPGHWPSWRDFTHDRWIPRTQGQ